MSKKPSAIEQVKVRMRADQKRKLEREADRNGLTLNAEILRRLERTFGSETADDVAAAFDTIQKGIELQRTSSTAIPPEAGAPGNIIAYALAHLLAKIFPTFRSIRISFGEAQGALWDDKGEEQIILVRNPVRFKPDPKKVGAVLRKYGHPAADEIEKVMKAQQAKAEDDDAGDK